MDQFTASTWEETANDRFSTRRDRNGLRKTDLARKVAGLKATSGCDRFPTDVDHLASAVGIRTVRYVPLAVRGRLIREPGGFVAEINEELSRQSRRFVLAHEITHLLLERDMMLKSSQRIQRVGMTLGHKRIESLCDFGAREILLPASSVRKEVKMHNPSLEVVAAIANEADCSLELVAECICDLLGVWADASFLTVEIASSGVRLLRVLPSTSALIEIAENGTGLLHRALRATSVVSGEARIWVGSGEHHFSVQALSIGNQRLMMIASPRIR